MTVLIIGLFSSAPSIVGRKKIYREIKRRAMQQGESTGFACLLRIFLSTDAKADKKKFSAEAHMKMIPNVYNQRIETVTI